MTGGHRLVLFILVALLTGGCAPDLPPLTPAREQNLAHMFITLDRSVDPSEARRLAHAALTYSRILARRYRVATSPWLHNFLVNIGLKQRGLCYQWADDLQMHLAQLHLTTLTILPVGANIGHYWSEHNALVVIPARHTVPLAHALLLDPWRHSGDLYFTTVREDTRYRWVLRWDRLKGSMRIRRSEASSHQF